MKNYSKKLLIGITLCLPILSFSQKAQEPITEDLETLTPSKKMVVIRAQYLGTYQIQVFTADLHPLITPALMDLVLSSRMPDVAVVLDIEPGIKLYLPSIAEISSDEFIPLEETIHL
ncbi:MAG: hypothetical protein ACI837_001896 [Crocinitomicaceae bacterium]|jgi:hypothetical protein